MAMKDISNKQKVEQFRKNKSKIPDGKEMGIKLQATKRKTTSNKFFVFILMQCRCLSWMNLNGTVKEFGYRRAIDHKEV